MYTVATDVAILVVRNIFSIINSGRPMSPFHGGVKKIFRRFSHAHAHTYSRARNKHIPVQTTTRSHTHTTAYALSDGSHQRRRSYTHTHTKTYDGERTRSSMTHNPCIHTTMTARCDHDLGAGG